jgi:hypothetical protein
MGMHEDQVPGITFHFSKEAFTGTSRPGEIVVNVELIAHISDEEMWNAIKIKLRGGLRIYKGEDFHTAIIDAVKADLGDANDENIRLTRALRIANDARALAEEELARYKEPLARLGNALRGKSD